MGLDITAYSHLQYVGFCPDANEDDHEYEPESFNRRHVMAYAYEAFPHALAGIPDVRTDHFRSGEQFLSAGCFALTDKTETHAFRAGSYSGYNQWRDHLRQQFNPDTDPAGPFYELIWFADNEGTIGAAASALLLADFRDHASTYTPPASPSPEWWIETYTNWTRAFELAAADGLVDFH